MVLPHFELSSVPGTIPPSPTSYILLEAGSTMSRDRYRNRGSNKGAPE